jgi:hypothetical protein
VTADLIRVWLDIGHARVEQADRYLGAALQRLERLVPDLALNPTSGSMAPVATGAAGPEHEDRPARAELPRDPRTRSERSESGPREPSLGQLLAAVKEALAAPDVSVETLIPAVAPVRKLRELLDLVESIEGEDVAHRIEALLLAIHRTAPADVRALQGTTVALRQAGRGQDDLARRLLIDGEAAVRFGGPGVDILLPVAVQAQQAGWRLDRVLRGATRRERLDNAGLDALADALDGLWRLLVRRGDTKAEIWVVDHLPPEGRAAVAQLALEPHRRLAILPASSELTDGWSALGGPRAVGWPTDVGAELDTL